MTITLSNVEIALRADDVTTVEKGLTSLSTMMSAYGNRASGDRAEVSAVFLVLNGVQRISSPNSTSPIIP